MTKRGTGWVPDFPDVKDYTLSGQRAQALTSHLQVDEGMKSHEETAGQLATALKLLRSQTQAANDEPTSKETSKKIESLIKQLDQKAGGGAFFAKIKLHKVFQQGMSDPEVLRIKHYLYAIYTDFLELKRHSFNVFDSTFDELTKSLVEDFQSNRDLSPADGRVDASTMVALEWASSSKEALLRGRWPDYHYYVTADELQQIYDELQLLRESKKDIYLWQSEEQISNQGKTAEKVKQILKSTISRIKNIREMIIKALSSNSINVTPVVETWLKHSYEASIEEKLAHLETINHGDDSHINSAVSILSDVGPVIEQLINNIYAIPGSLPLPDIFETEKRTENIKALLPDQLLESILKNLFPSQDIIQIQQLTVPLTWSEFHVIPSGQGLGYLDKSSYVFKQRQKAAEKLNAQLDVLGINLDSNDNQLADDDSWFRAYRRAEIFKETSNLTEAVHDFVYEQTGLHWDKIYEDNDSNAASPHYYRLLFEEIAAAVQDKIDQFVTPVVTAVFRIIAPLGMQTNFDAAVKQGIETFEMLLSVQTILLSLSGDGFDFSSFDLMSLAESAKSATQLLQKEAFDETKILEKMKTVDTVDTYDYLTRVSIDAAKDLCDMLDSEPQSPIKTMMQRIFDRYQLTSADLEKIKARLTTGESSEQKQLLELLDANNKRNVQVDLKIPIDWELHQRIKQGSEKKAADNTNKGVLDEGKHVSLYLRLPDFVDLSIWCSPIENQGSINSCTAHAGVALTEYFAKKAFGKYTDVSPLFLYKTARNLMQRVGDSGASVRETMKAMVLFGIPPEEHWPYNEEYYDEEPTTFCYSFAQNYQALKYFRLDYAGIAEDALLIQIKAVLLAGFPCMFGFTLYTSIHDEANVEKGYIPYPSKLDKMEGGHAVVAVGYDDNRIIPNADGKRSKGAVLIRNSWGTDWGNGGYGWLPYDYILAGLTADWWSLLKSEWFESGKFGIGASHWKSGMGGRDRGGKK